ncbi:Protein kinase-like domain [Pseudocohnilembus persalinus]|uniref:Protein kinase-like domain n=1 Tax=Pseudocohnilembus persalinus TaxID=266149 RepID=A0A0V0Q8A6_PSEPJ|nr:Protein kinase-like domain [Pseudocohnilembus persalinus]|eukprot:KRW98378.1 Protein kinase-like domain [Pseudocohnilembus persalinus]
MSDEIEEYDMQEQLAGHQYIISSERLQLILEYNLDIKNHKMQQQYCEYNDKYILNMLSSQNSLFQKNEDLIIKYIKDRWEYLSDPFIQQSKNKLSLLKISESMIPFFFADKQDLDKSKQLIDVISQLEKIIDRDDQAYLNQEIRINQLILNCMQSYEDYFHNENYNNYVEKLIQVGLAQSQSIIIHQSSLTLHGLYMNKVKQVKSSKQLEKFYNLSIKSKLEEIRDKYFPINFHQIEENSQEFIDFKTILDSMINMTILVGQINLIEIFFPLFIQELKPSINKKIEKLINQFLVDNYIQLDIRDKADQIAYIFRLFDNQNIDTNLEHNLRFFLVKKILIPMIDNSENSIIIEFICGVSMNIQQENKYFEFYLKGLNFSRRQSDKLEQRVFYNLLQVQALECIMLILNQTYIKLSNEEIRNQFLKGSQLYQGTQSQSFQIFDSSQANQDRPQTIKQDNKAVFNQSTIHNTLSLIPEESQINEGDFKFNNELQNAPQNSDFEELEMDQINQHACMKTLIKVIDFMNKEFKDQSNEWGSHLLYVLENDQTTLSVRILLLKLLINRNQYFKPQSEKWFKPLLYYISLQNNGGEGFHYFLRDIVTLVIEWGHENLNGLQQIQREQKKVLCNCVNNIIKKVPHKENKQIFQQNIKILYSFSDLFKNSIFYSSKTLLLMIKNTGELSALWNINAIRVLQIALNLKIPVLENLETFNRVQNDNKEKYIFWSKILTNKVYQQTQEVMISSRNSKEYSKDAAVLIGLMIKFLKELGLYEQNKIELETQAIRDVIQIEQHKEKTIRDKFTIICTSITLTFPQILDNRTLFVNFCDLITRQERKNRARALQTLTEYIKQYENIGIQKCVQNIREISMHIEREFDKIMHDNDELNQQQFLILLQQLSKPQLLTIKEVQKMFMNKFQSFYHFYQKNESVDQSESYFQILFRLDSFYNDFENENKIQEEFNNQDQNHIRLGRQVKEAILNGLMSQHNSIRKKVFIHLDQNDPDNKQPTDRLLYLIKKIYSPNEESLWLVSTVPLLLTLSTRSSDYEKELFEDQLEQVTKYIDWDFQDSILNKRFNSTQPITPISYSQQGSLLDDYRVPQNKTQQKNQLPEGYIWQTQVGELPDIRIQLKDIIDPLIELSYYDEQLSSDLFPMIFVALFQNLENKQTEKTLLESLEYLLNQTQQFNFYFTTTIQKTMLQLTKKGFLFNSKTIKQAGLGSHAYHTSVLLIEESLFSKQYNRQFDFSKNIKKFQRSSRQNKNQLQIEVNENTDGQFDSLNTDNISYWMDLLEFYSQLHENDNTKGVLTKVLQKSSGESAIQALDFKMNGQIKVALIKFSNFLNEYEAKQIKEESEEQNENYQDEKQVQENLKARYRIKQYIFQEKLECLQMLQRWEELSVMLNEDNIEILDDPQKLGINKSRLIFHSYLKQEQQWNTLEEICRAWDQKSSQSNLKILEGPLSYEMALIQVISNDMDRARYYQKLASDYFLKTWPNYGIYAQDSRHEFLQNIQKNFELKEFLDLERNRNLNLNFQDSCSALFSRWTNRQPSYTHDNLLTWDQILIGRELYSYKLIERFKLDVKMTNNYIQSWNIQNAKGMVKKGLYDAANPKMREAVKLKKINQNLGFNWEFYKNTAKLKLKELDLNLRYNLQNEQDSSIHFRKLNEILDKELTNNVGRNDSVTKFKFQFLQYKVLDRYIELMNDKILITNLSESQLMGFSDVLDEIFKGYQCIFDQPAFNQQINYSETFSIYKKENRQIMEGETVKYLRDILIKSFEINILQVAEKFVQYSIKSFELVGEISQAEYIQEIQTMSQSYNEDFNYERAKKQFKCNSEVDKNLATLLIKMLQVIEKFPEQLGPLFKEAISSNTIPVWTFLQYIPQIIHIINNKQINEYFEELFEKIVDQYHEVFIYQFNTIYQQEIECQTELSLKIYRKMHQKYPEHFRFIHNLNSLTHPHHRCIYFLSELKTLLQDIKKNVDLNDKNQDVQEELARQIKIINQSIQYDLFQKYQQSEKVNYQFSKAYKSKIEKVIQQSNHFLESSLQVQENIIRDIGQLEKQIKLEQDQNDNLKSGNQELKVFSVDLFNFYQDFEIEIPGQYGMSSNSSIINGTIQEPQQEQHIKISSFSPEILCLGSIRRPKRLIINGDNEKQYLFLVKGSEDLRLDQRIEQLFDVMNTIFQLEAETQKRKVNIATFNIIPMSKTLGLLEWIDKTKVLKEIVNKELMDQKAESLNESQAFSQRIKFIQQLSASMRMKDHQNNIIKQHNALLKCEDYDFIKENFEKHVDILPNDLLRNSLQRLSINSEAYQELKNKFIKNYSVLCLAGYILGIGDRHLENYLINIQTGDIVAIDFGISFGQGINLTLPELMPFRLTNQFQKLMSPIGFSGVFRHTMVQSLKALKKRRHLLLDYCDIFIKDPVMDWIKLSKNKRLIQNVLEQKENKDMNSNQENVPSQDNSSLQYQNSISFKYKQSSEYSEYQSSQWTEISKGRPFTFQDEFSPDKNIQIVKFKLIGANPSRVFEEQLNTSRHANTDYFKNIIKVVKGQGGVIRQQEQYKAEFLNELEVIDMLIDQASDSNILGRTWLYWSPQV